MNTHPYDFLPVNDEGAGLILTPCPGSRGVAPGVALDQLKAAGAAALLTLMPAAELASNAVEDMAEMCSRRNIQWFHFPIEDAQAPGREFVVAWQAQRSAVHRLLDEGGKLAIHCKGGSGRTGLMAAQLLVERGWPSSKAVAAVKARRPTAFSELVQQQYIAQLAVCAPPGESAR